MFAVSYHRTVYTHVYSELVRAAHSADKHNYSKLQLCSSTTPEMCVEVLVVCSTHN